MIWMICKMNKLFSIYSKKFIDTLPAFLPSPNFNIIQNCIFFYFSLKQHSFKCSKMKKIISVLFVIIHIT